MYVVCGLCVLCVCCVCCVLCVMCVVCVLCVLCVFCVFRVCVCCARCVLCCLLCIMCVVSALCVWRVQFPETEITYSKSVVSLRSGHHYHYYHWYDISILSNTLGYPVPLGPMYYLFRASTPVRGMTLDTSLSQRSRPMSSGHFIHMASRGYDITLL